MDQAREEIVKKLYDKINSYISMINNKREVLSTSEIAHLKEEFFNKISYAINGISTNESYLDYITELIFDEVLFLNVFTSSISGTRGIVYDAGESKLYEGINQSLTYSLINTMALYKGKCETFNYPIVMEPDENVTLFQVKDSVTLDMIDIFKDNLYKMYFTGNGENFHRNMKKIFSEDELVELSNIVDESIRNNNENSYNKYSRLIKNAKEISKDVIFEFDSKMTL